MLLIADGTNLAHRAYYAMKNTTDGIPVSASGVPVASTSGVLRSLLTVVKEHSPTHIIVVFDNDAKTFRHQHYAEYKAGRKEREASLIKDIQTLQNLLILAGIGVIAPTGYEADDVIASLRYRAKAQSALIYSNDRDLWQLIDATTTVLCPSKGAVTVETVMESLGIRPDQVVDYKALKGDTTDNIPGIKGIGEKMAIELLSRYETLENIYQSIWQITGRPYRLLYPNQAKAQLSKRLAMLIKDVALDRTIDSFRCDQFQIEKMIEALNQLGLSALAKSYKQNFDPLS